MKKVTLILTFLILMTSGLTYGQDFRKTTWGMSKEQVKEAETGKMLKEIDDALIYRTKLVGYDTFLIYVFIGDKLTRAKYLINDQESLSLAYEKHSKYLRDYIILASETKTPIDEKYVNKCYRIIMSNPIKRMLEMKYGTSVNDNYKAGSLEKEFYKDEYLLWGVDVKSITGNALNQSSWDVDRSNINYMELDSSNVFYTVIGESYNLKFVIEYSSKEFGIIDDDIIDVDTLYKFSQTGFRTSEWGASITVVKINEKAKMIYESKTSLAYETTISDIKINVYYQFTEGKLTSGRYSINETHSSKNEYILDYITLKELLSKKYGQPKDDSKIWKINENKYDYDYKYKYGYSQWGYAVSLGHLFYHSSWEIEKTDIYIIISGNDFELSTSINYTSKELKEFVSNIYEKEILEDF